MTEIQILVWSAILTLLMLVVASLLRTESWTPAGVMLSFGNREDLGPATPIAGRAHRASLNMIEAMVLFTAIFAAVHFTGKSGTQTHLGAMLFFWARVAYWPCYLAGIVVLRTVIWLVSVFGLLIMAAAVW